MILGYHRLWHTGGLWSYITNMAFFPEQKIGKHLFYKKNFRTCYITSLSLFVFHVKDIVV